MSEGTDKDDIKMSINGLVFDIQRYSLHDGPGIRTVAFLKGCPLRCLWCANPESFVAEPSLYYIKSRCIHCRKCIEAAPQGAVQEDEKGNLVINFKIANSHSLSWVRYCPTGAMGVKGQTMNSDELCGLLLRDEIFYRKSNGGITLSGGEPLSQGNFVLSVLKKMRECYNIHTVIETTGAVSWDTLAMVEPYVSLFLYDLKLLDASLHKKYTGVSNERILDNLGHLARTNADIMVRTPIIPGINDSEKVIRDMAEDLVRLGIRKYSLLPFHQLGKGKYDSLGYQYTLGGLVPPSDEQMEHLRCVIQNTGLEENYETMHV